MAREAVQSYPLSWPAVWPRCDEPEYSRFETSLVNARDGLLRELALLGARNVVISSNARVLENGVIASRQVRIDDTGVAVYFDLDGQQRCIPCDRWVRLEENLHAIELSIAAIRGLARWGSPGLVDAAFQGFAALPAGADADAWWVVLGVNSNASEAEVDAAFRSLAKRFHPDVPGGDDVKFRRVNDAYRAFKGRGR